MKTFAGKEYSSALLGLIELLGEDGHVLRVAVRGDETQAY